MRAALDRLYAVALWLSAACLVSIALLVGAQLGGRLIDGSLRLLGAEPVGIVILSLAELSGSLLAAASFLALAGTLKAGAHIRITMLMQVLPPRLRYGLELWTFGAAAMFSGYIAWQLATFAYVSFQYDEVSPGVVRFPLAIPQTAMALGAIILTIALIDEFLTVRRTGGPSFQANEDAITLGKAE
ncbi:TRAP transporter small permease [Pseudorhodoplanes sp.]|uniref:TRAP transporter small permease n=1 Tax=Pseudorhodoplanes sp. TaxID=1934341 RepID=UPI003D0A71F5